MCLLKCTTASLDPSEVDVFSDFHIHHFPTGTAVVELKLFLWVLLQQVKIDSFTIFNIYLFVKTTQNKKLVKGSPGYPI